MPTYQRADKSVDQLAEELLRKYEPHAPIITAGVTIDIVMAHADLDDDGHPVNDAISQNGHRAFGLTRKMPLKDRALGRKDAEITLDGDWWEKATPEQQSALLDHELHHIAVKTDRAGNIQLDDLARPQLKLRKHDVEVGWFSLIAERHGAASLEQIQAKSIMDGAGQYFWPDIAPSVQIESGGVKTKRLPLGVFAKAAAKGV